MSSQKVSFTGATGVELAARLDMPLGKPAAYAIFAHCFTCSKDTKAATYVSAALAEQGIATLRFDFTGLGGSGDDLRKLAGSGLGNDDFAGGGSRAVRRRQGIGDITRSPGGKHRERDILRAVKGAF